MRVKSKAELKADIAALEKHNQELAERQEQARRQEWERLIPEATAAFFEQVKRIFPNLISNTRFEHVDASGYWFTFELVNDARRQTYAVRHNEL